MFFNWVSGLLGLLGWKSTQLVFKDLAARAVNFVMSELYKSGFWIPAADGARIGAAGMTFLQAYSKLARLSHAAGQLYFPLFPKIHFTWHVFYQLQWESAHASWCISPLATAVPLDEDFIGHFARLTRRVHPLATISSAMTRYRVYAMSLMQLHER